MIDAVVGRIPVPHRFAIIYSVLAGVLFGVSFAGWYLGAQNTIVQTHTVRVEKSWGRPDQTIDAAQVNPQLAGMTCDVYNGRKTLVCHP